MMSFHIKRSQTAQFETLTQYNGLRSTRWERPPDGQSVHEIQTTHDAKALQKIPKGKNYMRPPYHCKFAWMTEVFTEVLIMLSGHWYQDEFFYVKEGYVGLSFTATILRSLD